MSGGALIRSLVIAWVLIGYGVLVYRSAETLSPTQDEPLHVAAGYSYWQEDDFRMQPENGVLSQRWVGFGPMLLEGGTEVQTESISWREGRQWFVAYQFIEENGLGVLVAGRMMIAACGLLLLLAIYFVARLLWGPQGAVVSLIVAAFSPTFLAHASLATSDIFLATTYFASAIALAAVVWKVSWTRVGIAGLTCGAAALSKYTSIVLAPYGIFLLILYLFIQKPPQPGKFLLSRMGGFLAVGIIAYLVLWSGYGFRYSTFHPDSDSAAYNQPLEELKTDSFAGEVLGYFRDNKIFPEPYLYGAELAYYYSRSRAAFFLGETGGGGWKLYFPVAFLAKSAPLVVFGTFAFFFYLLSGRLREFFRERNDSQAKLYRFVLGSTLLAGGLFFVFCFFSRLNIGHRHMLPVYPFLFVWIGASWSFSHSYAWRWILCGVLLVHGLWSFFMAPAFLSYINPFFGGPRNGHHLFADSSYDWGQEMYVLEEWLDENADGEDPLLAVFAPMRMEFYGIEGDLIYQFGAGYPINASLPPLRPGLVAVSATILSGPYFLTQSADWTERDEKNYWISRSAVAEVFAAAGSDPQEWANYLRSRPEIEWETILSAYARLRIKRLLYLIRGKEPLARPSDTIFIWEFTPEEFQLGGFLTEPALPKGFNLPLILKSLRESDSL